MKIAQESWLVVRYKINEQLRFERNLKNQDLNFYIPKITISIKKGANQKQVNKQIMEIQERRECIIEKKLLNM